MPVAPSICAPIVGVVENRQSRGETVATNAKTWPTAIITAVLALLVGALGTYGLRLALDSGDNDTDSGELTIRLEPADFVGNDPFSAEPFALPPDPMVASSERIPVANLTLNSAVDEPNPSAPGLYARSDASLCLVEPMIAFFAADPDKANIWIDAQNADPFLRWDEGQLALEVLPAYLRSLTPATLQNDTYVTNHDYREGDLIPVVSLLQRGTAVLVDQYGVPQTKCYSGNPLALSPNTVDPISLYGEGWPGAGEGASNPVATDDDETIEQLQTCEIVRRTFAQGVSTSPERCERNTDTANTTTTIDTPTAINAPGGQDGSSEPDEAADLSDLDEAGGDSGPETDGDPAAPIPALAPIPVETCADNNWPAEWLDAEASDRTGFVEVLRFNLTIVNSSSDDIQFVQHGYDCAQIGPNVLPAGGTWNFGSVAVGIPLTAATVDGQVLSEFQMPLSDATWTIGG